MLQSVSILKLYKSGSQTVSGYDSPGDGGGGDFYYDAKSTVAENNGTIIRPTSIPIDKPGRWIRVFDRQINILWFGAKRDGSADAYPAIKKAMEAAAVSTKNAFYGTQFHRGVIYIPGGIYRVDSTIIIKNQLSIIGEANGETWLIFPDNTRAIDINYDKGAHGNYPVVLKNLNLRRGAGTGLNESAHAIWLNMAVDLESIYIDNFGGNGIEVNTSEGGNANNSKFRNVTCFYCNMNGLFFTGGESNNCSIYASDFTSNGRCGVLDNGFLGNKYFACHTSSNGIKSGYAGFVKFKGNIYQCISYPNSQGVEPGTVKDFKYHWAIPPSPPGELETFKEWNKDAVYYPTGSYVVTSPVSVTELIGCYSEGGQGASRLSSSSLSIGGDHGAGFVNESLTLSASGNKLMVTGNGLHLPGGGIYFGDSKQIFGGESQPETGHHYAKEFCLYTGIDPKIIGWRCTESGSPGKWVLLKL